VSLSTHVLDATTGRPASAVGVVVEAWADGSWQRRGSGRTNDDGRINELGDPGAGVHRISFATGAYFARSGTQGFYPEVTITFEIVDPAAHHHVPLLLSPYAFSTYRGT
jgi:5-hydroxyisourate hydrolase